MIRRLLIASVLVSSFAGALLAQEGDEAAGPVAATLLSTHDAVVAGGRFRLGLRLRMKKGWHVSWTNPGAAGEPVKAKAMLPDGFKVGFQRWPAPSIEFAKGVGQCYCHSGEMVVVYFVEVSPEVKPGEYEMAVDASWVALKKGEKEVRGKAHATVKVTVGKEAVGNIASKKIVARWHRWAPAPGDAGAKIELVKGEGRSHWKVTVPAGKARKVKFAQFVPLRRAKRLRGVVARSKEGADSITLMVPIVGTKKDPAKAVLRGVLTIRGTRIEDGKHRRFEQSFILRPKTNKK